MHVRKVAVVCLYLISVFVSIVLAGKESNKRMPGSSHAFQQMVRYGRSSNKDGKINVYPRADVFYLGPRYGKRSKTIPSHLDTLNSIHASENDRTFSCTYAGVSNLYRCNNSRRSTVKQTSI